MLSPTTSPLGKLLTQYVLIRVTRMDDVDLGLFDHDRYNTLYFYILNSEEQIYLRYGGRDAVSPDTYLNLESIRLAAEQGLELHRQFQAGKLERTPRPKALFPREIPALAEVTFAKNRCVECHLIGDLQNVQHEEDGKLDKLMQMFRSPDLKTIGIHLDVPKGLVVKEAQGAVAAAGLRAGDRITAINGVGVWTFADLQHQYDKVPRPQKKIALTVDRAGTAVDLAVTLPVRWWLTDIRYRQLSVDPRVYFESRPLTDEEKKQHQLKPSGFASQVTRVDAFAGMLKSHELKAGDIIYAVDGVEEDAWAHTADLYLRLHRKAGDSVKLQVIREGQRVEMPLKTLRMSFRK